MIYAKRLWIPLEEHIYVSKKENKTVFLVSKTTNFKLHRFAGLDSLEEAREILSLLEKEQYPSSDNLVRIGLAYKVWKKINPDIRLCENAFRMKIRGDWKHFIKRLPGRREFYIHMDDIPKMNYSMTFLCDL